jgi:hypothetical protein
MNLQRNVPFSLPALCPNQEGWVGSICADLPLSLSEAGLVLVGFLLLLLLVLNQRKKKIISSKSRALADTEARYRLLFEHSPIPLLEEDLSAVKTFVDELRSRDITDLDRYFTDNPESLNRCAALSRIHRRQQGRPQDVRGSRTRGTVPAYHDNARQSARSFQG